MYMNEVEQSECTLSTMLFRPFSRSQPAVAEQIDCTFNPMCPGEGERCVIWYLPFPTLLILLPSFTLLFL